MINPHAEPVDLIHEERMVRGIKHSLHCVADVTATDQYSAPIYSISDFRNRPAALLANRIARHQCRWYCLSQNRLDILGRDADHDYDGDHDGDHGP